MKKHREISPEQKRQWGWGKRLVSSLRQGFVCVWDQVSGAPILGEIHLTHVEVLSETKAQPAKRGERGAGFKWRHPD